VRFPFIAQCAFATIYDIEPEALAEKGIRLLLSDLDNTLVPYGVPGPTSELRAWVKALEEHGVTLFILSNNRSPRRVSIFAKALAVPFIGHAGKPRPGAFRRAMEEVGCAREETAVVGDQIFTDIWGGSNAGITTILVKPIKLKGNPGRYLRYAAEWLFRVRSEKRRRTT